MVKKKREIPKYVLKNMGIQTQRQFKAQKRHELKVVMEALEQYRRGCAYCPPNNLCKAIQDNLQELIKLHSVKMWGR